MNNIKNIIFDLGGVFIDINYQKTEVAFINAGITNFNELYNQHRASSVFEDLETGKISASFFYNELRNISKTQISDTAIKSAWNAMLGDFLLKEIDWLASIKNKYRLFLYSNTNQIHYEAFTRLFQQETGNSNFDDYFIKAYYSHMFGLRKPYAASYQKILEEQKILAAETLFIDDTLVNIEGAKNAGLQTLHLVPPLKVSELGL
jgi:HAD superfamily hydrolase (TIGR01549 family)